MKKITMAQIRTLEKIADSLKTRWHACDLTHTRTAEGIPHPNSVSSGNLDAIGHHAIVLELLHYELNGIIDELQASKATGSDLGFYKFRAKFKRRRF